MVTDPRLNSPDPAERIAARLDLIDENLAESGRLGGVVDMLHAQVEAAGRWRRRERRKLLREAGELIEARWDLISKNDRLMTANSIDLFNVVRRG